MSTKEEIRDRLVAEFERYKAKALESKYFQRKYREARERLLGARQHDSVQIKPSAAIHDHTVLIGLKVSTANERAEVKPIIRPHGFLQQEEK